MDASSTDAARVDGTVRHDAGPVRDAGIDAARPDGGVCAPGASRSCGAGGFQHCSGAGTWCQCNAESDMGSPMGWVGCRGNGLAVCRELVAAHPCYWENHPRCSMNELCEGAYFACNRDCPEPTAADACECVADPTGWEGCSTSPCGACEEVLEAYPCYFLHHWGCAPATCGAGRTRCDAKCPAPVEADRGSLVPAP